MIAKLFGNRVTPGDWQVELERDDSSGVTIPTEMAK
jgi:hypothetical protein